MRLCLETIAEACGSGIPADAKSTVVTSVVTDSRRAVPGSLFVCIPGERVDGHDFAVKAVENGSLRRAGAASHSGTRRPAS